MGSDSTLRAGDCLLYKPVGVFGSIIAIKTWHQIAHVEVYVGPNAVRAVADDKGGEHRWVPVFDAPASACVSVASRDKKGVNFYPTRITQLAYVLRPQPQQPLDLAAGLRYARRKVGTPYGWADLLNFIGFKVDGRGIVCSPFATEFYRACGWNIFPTDPSNAVAPFQFLDLVGSGFAIVKETE